MNWWRGFFPGAVNWEEVHEAGLARFVHEDEWPAWDNPRLLSFLRPGYVSLWISYLTDPEAFHQYAAAEEPWAYCEEEEQTYSPFLDDCGLLGIYSYDHHLARFSPEPVPLIELLESLPHSLHFGLAVIRTCESLGITTARGIICEYDFDFFGRSVFGNFAFGQIRYVGSFRYR